MEQLIMPGVDLLSPYGLAANLTESNVIFVGNRISRRVQKLEFKRNIWAATDLCGVLPPKPMGLALKGSQ